VDALPELHRPWLDAIAIRCPGCAEAVRRVPEVGDCWLDAGVVPFSTLRQREDRAEWRRWFPADFIVEAVGQLRGWFYAMLFMATALEGRSPYRTVLAHERVLAADGREMHKSAGNAVRLEDALAQMGPDVVRHIFASQPITEPLRWSAEAGRDVKRRFLTLWNVYGLFVTYANVDRPALERFDRVPAHPGPLEQWLLSRLQATVAEVRSAFDAYQIRRAVSAVDAFIHDDLSNWYVRRRRRQFWKAELDHDKQAAYQGLYHVLVRVGQLLAPVMPFMAEHLYRSLVPAVSPEAPPSIHLVRFPEPDPALARPALEGQVASARRVLTVGLAARNAAGLKVRQPLARALVVAPPEVVAGARAFEADVLDELNVERLEPVSGLDGRDGFAEAVDHEVIVALDTAITPDLRRKGLARHLVHHVQILRKAAGLDVEHRIRLAVEADGEVVEAVERHRTYIAAETLAVELRLGAAPAGWTAREADLDRARAIVAITRA
jgi:isoleucyl-tRNA synthetase